MLAAEDKKQRIRQINGYPSSLPVSSSTKATNTPKRPAKEVIGQIHRRLSSSNFDTANGRISSIPLRVTPYSMTITRPRQQQQQQQQQFSTSTTTATPTLTTTLAMSRTLDPNPTTDHLDDDRRYSYMGGQEPFVNRKSIRKSAIYPSTTPDQTKQQRHYQYHQAPSSPIALAPERPLSFSRPRSTNVRHSMSPPVDQVLDSIPPVPPIPDQVLIGKYRQINKTIGQTKQHQINQQPQIRSASYEISSSFTRPKERHRESLYQNPASISTLGVSGIGPSTSVSTTTHTRRNSQLEDAKRLYRKSTSGLSTGMGELRLTIPKSQTAGDLHSSFAFKEPPLPPPPFEVPRVPENTSKSPYRPLNRPSLIHPPRNEGPQMSESPSLESPLKNRIRSKSTAPKPWIPIPTLQHSATHMNLASRSSQDPNLHVPSSTVRSGQSSVTATRRMLFSPFPKKPKSPPKEQPTTESVLLSVNPKTRSSPDGESEDYESENDREVRAIMRRLITSKNEDAVTRKRLEEIRRHGPQPQPSMTASVATKTFKLNLYEKGEILDFRKVYFCGRSDAKKISGDIRRSTGNYGFDDDKGDYKVVSGDHIAYRYEILAVLGKGSFGKVVKCVDHKTGKLVAVKMIINRKRFHMQALVEADILKTLAAWDPKDKYHLVRYTEHFNFRDHLCIATELLGINLYELIKYNNYKGLPVTLVKNFTRQILEALRFLDAKTVIHCDLKPENVLISDIERGRVKIIDFGSSCYESERVYTYIQSRFYRSPEVMLGMSYSQQIDIWSLGCIVAELLTGRPLFMGENEQEQIACIMEIFGLPDKNMLSRCARRKLFFDSMGNPRMNTKEKKHPGSKRLEHEIKQKDLALLDFVSGLLSWNPKKRLTAAQALQHEWITGVKASTTPISQVQQSAPIHAPPTPTYSHRHNSSSGSSSSKHQPRHTQPQLYSHHSYQDHAPSTPPLPHPGFAQGGFKASPRQMQQRLTPKTSARQEAIMRWR